MATTSRSATFPTLSSVQDSIFKEGQKLIGKDGQKFLKSCADRAEAVRKDVKKRADTAVKSLRSQTDRLRSDFDSRIRRSLEPIVRRLSLPTKHEVDQLAKRLSSLEKKVDRLLSARA